MTCTGAERSCDAALDRLDDARRELLAAGQVDWTGPAAAAYASVLTGTVGRLTGLRHTAEQTRQAVRRHAAAVEAVRPS